jgi:hypothetical protein
VVAPSRSERQPGVPQVVHAEIGAPMLTEQHPRRRAITATLSGPTTLTKAVGGSESFLPGGMQIGGWQS